MSEMPSSCALACVVAWLLCCFAVLTYCTGCLKCTVTKVLMQIEYAVQERGGKNVSLCLSSVFRISAAVLLLQQQWQEEKEGQYMLPDLRVSAAALCFADVCGVVGKGASGLVLLQGVHKKTGVCSDIDA